MNPLAPIFATHPTPQVHDLDHLCQQHTQAQDYPHCTRVQDNVPIYAASTLHDALEHGPTPLMEELHHLFRHGPGVMVVRQGYADSAVIDRHSQVFAAIFAEEAAQGVAADHFAKAGSNGRIWNALQKAAEHGPASFVEYYANPLLGLIAEAWLGPYYQITAQVNVVHPGGAAQQPHRDYHLGFQTTDEARRFPLPLHELSQYLTLQGAVAHSDMPLESGPTLLLPFSQRYPLGYLAWREPDFIDYFQHHAVQLPLDKGDLLFFNPALLHAAGANRTTNHPRMANLLQISSAFGKPMETVNRERMMQVLYPSLLDAVTQSRLDTRGLNAVIAAIADGYAFPTNLDRDPPLHGLAPQTGQQLLHEALAQRWPYAAFAERVQHLRHKRLA